MKLLLLLLSVQYQFIIRYWKRKKEKSTRLQPREDGT